VEYSILDLSFIRVDWCRLTGPGWLVPMFLFMQITWSGMNQTHQSQSQVNNSMITNKLGWRSKAVSQIENLCSNAQLCGRVLYRQCIRRNGSDSPNRELIQRIPMTCGAVKCGKVVGCKFVGLCTVRVRKSRTCHASFAWPWDDHLSCLAEMIASGLHALVTRVERVMFTDRNRISHTLLANVASLGRQSA
jgi:hypothetical protein